MSKPKGKDSRKRRRPPAGLQFSLDQEAADQAQATKGQPGVIENSDGLEPVGEGYRYKDINNIYQEREVPPHPPSPPSPPRERKCLWEDPATRETIRRKLKELEVTNINQLLRSYTAAELIEAISDFERAVDEGMEVRSPTAYFRSLLL